jgi:hypothetical protein
MLIYLCHFSYTSLITLFHTNDIFPSDHLYSTSFFIPQHNPILPIPYTLLEPFLQPFASINPIQYIC